MQMSLSLLAVAAFFGGPCPANARMLRLPTQIQHLSKEPAVVLQHLESRTISYPSNEASGVNAILYSLLSFAGLSASVLLLFCLYDAAKQWRHRSHFLACKRKIQRVHEVLERSSGELPLCPYCVEYVSSKASRSAVVFLCGHRFHIDCANSWLRDQDNTEGNNACPLCESCAATELGSPVEDGVQGVPNESDGTVLGQPDEFKSFILRSLSEEYPEIIREDCVKRWCQCHTELWLSELSCPRYKSIFQTKQLS